MTFIVATNVIASRPPERRPTGTPHARAKIHGPVWYHMVPYGTVWYRMVSYGPLWSCMFPFRPIWSPMASYGLVLSSIVSYGSLWSHVVLCMVPCMVPFGNGLT